MSSPLENRTIWLTGASKGIGYELAKVLVRRGNKLIVTSRSPGELTSLMEQHPHQIHFIQADIADSQSTEQLSAALNAITDSLDTIILNAGTCEYLDADHFDMALVERVTQVNYLGFVRCIAASLPLLRKSANSPHLVGICSAAAYIGLPRSEAYGASKAAIRHFLQSLRLDLGPAGIDVSIVYPGFVDTPLTRQNDFPMPFLMSSEEAVSLMIKGMEKRKMDIAFPKKLIWPLRLLSALPPALSFRLCKGMVRQPAS